MSNPEIQLSRKLTTQLLHLAQISPKTEICGLISAKHGQAYRCYPIENIAAQPNHRFLLDPHQQISAIKTMRSRGEDLFAIYHSHPDSPAEPSANDIELAAYPEALYLIISLSTKGVLEMRGFHIVDEQVEAVNLSMTE